MHKPQVRDFPLDFKYSKVTAKERISNVNMDIYLNKKF